MKKQFNLAAAIVLALAAGNASADLTLSFDPSDSTENTPVNNGAGSSILLAVNDQQVGSTNYGHTFLLDLSLAHSGLNYASFVNGTQGANATLSWNLSNYSAFSSYAADTSHLNWSVVGASVLDGNNGTNLGSASGFPLTAVAPWGVVETTQNPNVWTGAGVLAGSAELVSQTTVQTNSPGGALSTANISLHALSASSNVVDAPASGTGAYTYIAQLPNEGFNGVGSNSFYFITNATGLTGGADVNTVTRLGSFALNSSDVLTYTSASTSAVPLPAGAWLFLSGLLGVLGLKRRNQQAAIAI